MVARAGLAAAGTAFLVLFLAGCATSPLVLIEPVGPAPRIDVPAELRGTLMVYSAWEVTSSGDSDYRYREDYVLHWPGDTRTQRVKNHAGTFDEGPVPVSLPPGTYRIKARAARHGQVMASVIIEAGRTTLVRLDGTAPVNTSGAESSLVRLPSGEVVGWKAQQPK